MMVMTAKVDLKKILLFIAGAAALVLAAVLLLGGGEEGAAPTAGTGLSGNDSRVQFLKDFGWDVVTSPVESGQVKIPKDSSGVFDRYNLLQKSQGYDLSRYAGKHVMRYVYEIKNYPGASGPVYATLLVHRDQVIGGDVTDTSPGGKLRGFPMPETAATAPSAAATAETAGQIEN